MIMIAAMTIGHGDDNDECGYRDCDDSDDNDDDDDDESSISIG